MSAPVPPRTPRGSVPPPNVSLGWSEGRWFDLWMVVHFLGGLAGGASNVLFGLPPRTVLTLGAALMLLWEGAEYVAGVRESRLNRTLDVLVGLVGVLCALELAERLGPAGERRLLLGATALFAAGCVRGWIAYRRRWASAR